MGLLRSKRTNAPTLQLNNYLTTFPDSRLTIFPPFSLT